jgi:hypothetical protein
VVKYSPEHQGYYLHEVSIEKQAEFRPDQITCTVSFDWKETLENSLLLQKHSQRLEQLVEKEPASRTSAPVSPAKRLNSTTAPVQSISRETQRFDIHLFSNQGKRILAAFFRVPSGFDPVALGS